MAPWGGGGGGGRGASSFALFVVPVVARAYRPPMLRSCSICLGRSSCYMVAVASGSVLVVLFMTSSINADEVPRADAGLLPRSWSA